MRFTLEAAEFSPQLNRVKFFNILLMGFDDAAAFSGDLDGKDDDLGDFFRGLDEFADHVQILHNDYHNQCLCFRN